MAKEQSRARGSSKKQISKEVLKICEADDSESLSDDDLYDESSYSDSDGFEIDSDDCDDSHDLWNHLCFVDEKLLLEFKKLCSVPSTKKGCQNKCSMNYFNPSMAARNAQQLVEEEEREKRKAEKRKAKKKRRKERKKEEKERLTANKTDNSKTEKQDLTSDKKSSKSFKSSPSKPSSSSAEDMEDEEEFLDINSAFVSIAVSKKKKNSSNVSSAGMDKSRLAPKKLQTSGDQNVAESERLAIIGYKMASKEQYEQAVEYFSKAIRLVNNDHRFFSNRSFCHCQLGHYSKALKDADKAIALASNGPKGYYRRGEALKGLNLYKEAEEAFERVVQLDSECEDAVQELEGVKLHQLLEMGFVQKQALAALQRHHTVQATIDALTSGSFNEAVNLEGENAGDMFYSDEEEEPSTASFPYLSQTQESQQLPQFLVSKANKMDPSNPEGHLSLWVGNISQEVTEKQLVDIFSKFGVVLSVRLLPEKYCAFINFRDKSAPGPAMKTLQNRELGGERLLIRYPNNPVPEAHQQIIVKKTNKPGAIGTLQSKMTGPVNGDECHFWRTTGCAFGIKCRYRHLKENKGVDRKPWQKTT